MPKWLDVAQKYDGLAEVKGPASNPVILGWLQNEGGGKSWVKDDATAWCGAAMAGVFTEAGLSDVIPKDPLAARSWATVGEPLDGPKVGAIVVLDRHDDKNPNAAHVGIIEKFDVTHIWIRGGNQNDAFTVKAFSRALIVVIAYRWPIATKTSKDVAAEGSRIINRAQRQQVDAAKGTGATVSPELPVPAAHSFKDGVDGVLSNGAWLKGVIGQIADFAAYAGTHWWVVAAVIAGFYFTRVAWDGHQITEARVQDANEGWTQ